MLVHDIVAPLHQYHVREHLVTQLVFSLQISAARLRGVNGRVPGIALGNFSYAKDGLQLGSLAGNAFTIVLRGLQPHNLEQVSSAATQLKEHGFVNYFGLQRFGSGSIGTHEVGANHSCSTCKAAARGFAA